MPVDPTDNSVVVPPVSDPKDNSVSYETYTRTLAQAKKEGAKNKDLEQELNALKAEKEAGEQAQLAEQGKYKELHEASEARAQVAEQATASLIHEQTIARKREAVAAQIGQVSKPEFLQFINLDNIDLDNPDSITEEATRFKAEYPMVLATASASLPNGQAPGTPTDPKPKTILDMSDDELANFAARSALGV